jgi:hypothetical protein
MELTFHKVILFRGHELSITIELGAVANWSLSARAERRVYRHFFARQAARKSVADPWKLALSFH